MLEAPKRVYGGALLGAQRLYFGLVKSGGQINSIK